MFSLGLKCVKWLLFRTKLESSFVKWPKYRPETTFLRSSLSPRSQLTLAVCREGRKSGKAVQFSGIPDHLKTLLITRELKILL